MIKGNYNEDIIIDNKIYSKNINRSRFIPKNYIHKITNSTPNAISITFEGPWDDSWIEIFDSGRVKIYNWGRKVVFDSKYFNNNV
jgi:hypothetical protein